MVPARWPPACLVTPVPYRQVGIMLPLVNSPKFPIHLMTLGLSKRKALPGLPSQTSTQIRKGDLAERYVVHRPYPSVPMHFNGDLQLKEI